MPAPAVTDVVLVSMPFGPLRHPSIGLELLKASLPDGRARVLYFTLPYAARIGSDLYFAIVRKPIALIGEWIFAADLFGRELKESDAFLDEVIDAAPRGRRLTRRQRGGLLDARAAAGQFLDECAAAVLAHEPRIVGLTSVFQQHAASLALAKRLKAARPGLCVIMGGANCEGPMGLETMRQFPWLDAVFSGEADLVFAPFVDAVLAGIPPEPGPGIYTKATACSPFTGPSYTPAVTEMDRLPVPDYGDFFAQWEASPPAPDLKPRLLFEASRGCWWGAKHHCTFCGLNGATMAFRSKSAARALAELDRLSSRHPGRPIMLVDNILDTAYFRDLVPALAARPGGPSLFVEVKANLRKEQIRMLAEAGVTAIQPGIESLSARVLELMRKGITPLQNIQLLKWCTQYGVWPQWHWIWGFPGEPPDDYARLAALLPRLSHLPPPVVATPIRLDRFSPNFEDAARLGFSNVRPVPAYGAIYPFDARALANLAYYFAYDYADRRDVDAYTRPLARAIRRWQQAYETSELYYADNGQDLWVYDFRPCAERPTTMVTGVQRALFLACDEVRSVAALRHVVSDGTGADCGEEDVTRALQPLVDQGLVLRMGHQVLSLATSVDARPRARQTVATEGA